MYDAGGTTAVIDPGAAGGAVASARTVTIETAGSASAVVWNPWAAKAAAMADFGDDEWTGMVCVETANALDAAIRIEPGATHTLRAVLSVR